MSRKTSTLLMSVAAATLATTALNATPAAAQSTTTTSSPVKPYYGNLRPFYGNLRPFYGNLRPFYGNLRPFWGNLRPFWGDTGAFYGDLKSFWATSNPVVGTGAPAYAQVSGFWTKAGDDWTVAFNSAISGTPDQALIAGKVSTIFDDSRAFWGASVQAKTGKSFDEGFLNPFLQARGIDPADPNAIGKLDQDTLAHLFLEYYDGLMAYAGTDHVDHWMKTVNWTPSLTKTQGSGGSTIIGILDETFVGDASISGNIVRSDGVSDFTNGHGAAVGSLIVGHHDGKGVMGIAPDAKVIAYNPFDNTGSASWADVTRGVQTLKASGASVVNMSLGVPGTTMDNGWNAVFTDPSVALTLKNTVFVLAAGNDGVTQTGNVTWNALNPAFIVVGSVGVDGAISNFSNRPGEACLTTLGLCTGDKLKNHFLVAPGELILVSDGKGGVTRQTGTSFAAPLVSGAIALLHDRWPWLANYPRETVGVILNSAKDLGDPGVDAVYGYGLLDVTRSQSPLDFNKLIFFTVENGKMTPQTKSAVITRYNTVQQSTWDASKAFVYAFETLGLTRRDFAIPLSSKLVGQNVTTYLGAQEQFQAYLLTRMETWAKSGGKVGFANGFSPAMAVANPWGMDMTVAVAPRQARFGFRDDGPAYQSRFDVNGERSRLVFGFGDGAPQLAASTGFGSAGSYDIERGGADPLLGLASGGVYAALDYRLSDTLTFQAGALGRDQERERGVDPAFGFVGHGAERYTASAQRFALAYKPNGELTLTGSWTRLNEGSAILGVQSLDADDFRNGSTTDGYSLSVNWAATPKLSFMATGTMARTHASDGQQLSVGKGGLTASSFEAGFAATDLFRKGDRFQVLVSQPMFVEKGRLELQQVEIVDRQTGDLGIVSRGVDIAGRRRVAGEAIYLRPVQDGQGDVALFGRVETATDGAGQDEVFTGARFRLAF
ncbi:MAG: S8 family serine peptidase [Phenylobacterium sp.]|uniref:S8 family peptidase n=1 Tax=Phenylobacterium sp. TaxID=1871053 RepID=UPI001A61246C|nr:S8 family peptidase [Phenylobacterium sp.]MBL8773780.1 S8 family serine peptidase [Phenylobacterium sp.]